MYRIIALLRNINFWTIVGTLITIATVIVALQERRTYEVDLVVDGENPFELKKDETANVVAVLFGMNSVSCDSIEVQLPLKFRNNENKAITISYSIAPASVFSESGVDDFGSAASTPVAFCIEGDKIMQRQKEYLKLKYLTTRSRIKADGADGRDCKLNWSYDNMDSDGSARFKLFCVNGDDAEQMHAISYKIKENPKMWVAVGYKPAIGQDNLFVPVSGGFRK